MYTNRPCTWQEMFLHLCAFLSSVIVRVVIPEDHGCQMFPTSVAHFHSPWWLWSRRGFMSGDKYSFVGVIFLFYFFGCFSLFIEQIN